MTARSTDILFSYDHAFPWQVFAMGALLLLLAFAFRRTRWAALACLIVGTACMGGAALLFIISDPKPQFVRAWGLINSGNAAIVSAWLTAIYTFFTLIIIILSSLALRTWKEQLGGSYEFEIAKEGLARLNQVAFAIENLRDSKIHLGESELWAQNRKEKLLQVTKEFNLSLGAVSRIWGDEFSEGISRLNRYVNDLSLASYYMFEKKEQSLIDWHYDIYGLPRFSGTDNEEAIELRLAEIRSAFDSIDHELIKRFTKYVQPTQLSFSQKWARRFNASKQASEKKG